MSTGKSTDNGKQHKKHIHERLLFKTSWHSHFQWNLAGCIQYLIQKFLRNEGLLQASFIWLGLGFAFSHIPPAEVRGWWQGAWFLCFFLCRTQAASITSFLNCLLKLLHATEAEVGQGRNRIICSPFWEQSKRLPEGWSIRSQRSQRNYLQPRMGHVWSCGSNSFPASCPINCYMLRKRGFLTQQTTAAMHLLWALDIGN